MEFQPAPSPAERGAPPPAAPQYVDIRVDDAVSATFRYDPATKGLVHTGFSIHSPSFDLDPNKYVRRNQVENAAARALAHFKSQEQPDVPPGTQYNLDLGDQRLH